MKWDALRSRINGTMVTRKDREFASVNASMIWNELKSDCSPEVIVTVKNDDDVVTAINFARENGLQSQCSH